MLDKHDLLVLDHFLAQIGEHGRSQDVASIYMESAWEFSILSPIRVGFAVRKGNFVTSMMFCTPY